MKSIFDHAPDEQGWPRIRTGQIPPSEHDLIGPVAPSVRDDYLDDAYSTGAANIDTKPTNPKDAIGSSKDDMSDDELIEAMCRAWMDAPVYGGEAFAASDVRAMRAVLAVVRAHDRDALRVYGRHLDSCGDADAYNGSDVRTCSCGLDAAIAAEGE